MLRRPTQKATKPRPKPVVHVISPGEPDRRFCRIKALAALDYEGVALAHSFLSGETRVNGSVNEDMSRRRMITAGRGAELNGAGAVVIDCALDTALTVMGEELTIPVFGPLRAVLDGLDENERIGIIVPRPKPDIAEITEKLESYGVSADRFDVAAIAPDGRLNRLTLEDRFNGMALASANLIVNAGARVVIPCCTFDSIHVPMLGKRVMKKYGVKAINPLGAAVEQARAAVLGA